MTRWPFIRNIIPFSLMVLALVLGTTHIAAAGPTPQFPYDAPWFNVSRPLTAADLKGRVVLLDFFTPGCINCIHMIPVEHQLKHRFGDDLLIIGVNSPKFAASRQSANIEGFLRRYDIRDPVLTDARMTLWRDYNVFAWPTLVMLNPKGRVAGTFIGEKSYQDLAQPIAELIDKAKQSGELTRPPLPLKPLPPLPGQLLQPGKVAVGDNRVAVSDTGHNRVLIYSLQGKLLKIVGDGKPGDKNGPAATARFRSPQGLAFGPHRLYVADTDNQLIRSIDLKTYAVQTLAGNGERVYGVESEHSARDVGLNSPWGLRRVGGTLYIAMAGDHQVWRMNLKTRRIGPYAGSGREGLSDGPLQRATFAQSSGLAYHGGTLYVADPEASALRAIDLKKGSVHTLIGQGLFAFGLRNGAADTALLQHSQGVAYLDGSLYIADTFNNAIRRLNLKTDQVSTVVDGLAQPGGLAVLGPHSLLVADTNADRIVRLDTATGQVIPWGSPATQATGSTN
ncbi:MAG: hypothetical protein P8Y64_11330 [Gammaproteobacteria bacterium]|jgi:thiol-disulfide isomerase/thioredoxin